VGGQSRKGGNVSRASHKEKKAHSLPDQIRRASWPAGTEGRRAERLLFFLLSLCSKDVRLPVQLQRAMAAEAEAAREARAKARRR